MSESEKSTSLKEQENNSSHENQNEKTAESSALPTLEQWQAVQAQLKEAETKYLYLYADFENYKKRIIKERSDLIKYGWEAVARDFLNVLDNLERAFEHAPKNAETDKEVSSWAEGIRMVVQEFKNTLKKHGVVDLESVGKPFDPNFHEAVETDKSENTAVQSGHVFKEVQKGYTLHGRLIRPAKVIVKG